MARKKIFAIIGAVIAGGVGIVTTNLLPQAAEAGFSFN
jgi:hypothetical protein